MNIAEFKEADSFLVVRLGAIGDVLRVCPAVRRLRLARPDARIAWAVEQWAHPVVAANPNVDRFHILDRKALRGGVWRAQREFRRFVREIRAEKYRVILDFHGRFKSGLVTRGSGARCRVGYARGQSTELNHLFTNAHVRLEDPLENRVLRYLHLLGALDIDTSLDWGDLGIALPEAESARAAEWYASEGRPTLAVYPGCSAHRMRHNRWPVENWTALLKRLSEAGVGSVVFWGPEERETAEQIADATPKDCRLAPETSLTELMAMIERFGAYAGLNTAAMHMAWLQGVPTAVFTGTAEPRTDAPLDKVPSRVLVAEEYAAPGSARRGHGEAIEKVTVDEAFTAIQSLLEETCKREKKQHSVS